MAFLRVAVPRRKSLRTLPGIRYPSTPRLSAISRRAHERRPGWPLRYCHNLLGFHIGKVILEREAGEMIPEIQGRFGQWLRRRHHFTKAAVRNAKSRVNRARRLLHRRTFANGVMELAAIHHGTCRLSERNTIRSSERVENLSEVARRTIAREDDAGQGFHRSRGRDQGGIADNVGRLRAR